MPLFNRGFGRGVGPSQGFMNQQFSGATAPRSPIGPSMMQGRKRPIPMQPMGGMMQQFRQPRIQIPGMGTAGMGGSFGGKRRGPF